MEIILKKIETGCIIPISHKLNHDGYFRKYNGTRLVMYHRTVWEAENGEIPKGYEIDHECKNRACCNIEHLQILTSSEHRTKDNTGRNKERKLQAFYLWYDKKAEISGAELGRLFGVTQSSANQWIREWRKDGCRPEIFKIKIL